MGEGRKGKEEGKREGVRKEKWERHITAGYGHVFFITMQRSGSACLPPDECGDSVPVHRWNTGLLCPRQGKNGGCRA